MENKTAKYCGNIFYNINFEKQIEDGKLNSLNDEFSYSARREHGDYIIIVYAYRTL